jgi:chromosome segregation ATPase
MLTEEMMRGVPTIEEFWVSFNKSREEWDREMAEIRALHKESDERRKVLEEEHKKTDEQFQRTEELMRENAEQQKRNAEQQKRNEEDLRKTREVVRELSRRIGGLNGSMGQLVEDILAARLHEKFRDFPYEFTGAYRNLPIYNENYKVIGEVDCLLVGIKCMMAAEMKRHLKKEDVEHHIRRIELIRKYLPFVRSGDRLLGALGTPAVDAELRDYAYGAGLFVLELTGDSVGLAEIPAGFKPREW